MTFDERWDLKRNQTRHPNSNEKKEFLKRILFKEQSFRCRMTTISTHRHFLIWWHCHIVIFDSANSFVFFHFMIWMILFFFFLIYFRMIIRRLISEDSSPFLSSFFMVLMMGLSWEVDLLSDTWTRRERGRLPKEATMKNDDDDDEVSCITKYFFMLKSKKANTRSSWVAKTLDFLLDLPVTCWGGRTAFALE